MDLSSRFLFFVNIIEFILPNLLTTKVLSIDGDELVGNIIDYINKIL